MPAETSNVVVTTTVVTDDDESTESSTTGTLMRDDRKVIFINIVVLDASDAITLKLSKTMNRVPKPLAQAATKLATSLATPERIAEVMSKEMPKKLVEKMASKGLTAAAETAFCEGPYVVLQMQIHSVSTQAMIEAQALDTYDDDGELEEKAAMDQDLVDRIVSWLQSFLAMIGIHRQRDLEDKYLPRLIQSKMETVMGEVMKNKLDKQGMQAISKVNSQEEQARFFFNTLREVRQVKDANRVDRKVAGAFAVASTSARERIATTKTNVKSAVSNFKAGAKERAINFKPKFPGKKVE